MNKRLSSFLNVSRWLAAFLVLVGHVRHLVLADYVNVVVRSPLIKAVYFLTGFGHEAVMVFFVVSGYLVGGLAITQFRRRGFDAAQYAVNRTSRIYTVLLPALVLGGLVDVLGLTFFNHSGLYTASAQYKTASLDFVISNSLNATTFAANIAMLEDIVSPRLGSNGPLWSLVYEWWYYCIFGCVMMALSKSGVVRRILAGGFLLAAALFLPGGLLLWSLIWMKSPGVFDRK